MSSAQDATAVADLATIEDRVQAVYRQVGPATVRFAYGKDPKLQFGSGVIVSAEGHVAVSGPVHSVLQNGRLDLRLADGRRVGGQALGWSSEFGFGLLKIFEQGPWPHVELVRGADVQAGQLCIGVGYPEPTDSRSNEVEHRPPTLRLGVVTKSAESLWLSSSYRFNAGAHCVFDLEGRLLGLNCKTSAEGYPLHTSATLIKTHWDDLVAGKNLDRVRLGADAPAPGGPAEPQAAAVAQPDETAIKRAMAAAVRICDVGQSEGIASGVIVTPDGYVITCGHHQRLPGQRLTVALADGRDAGAVVVGTNLVSDVGLIKITDEGTWPHIEMGHSATMLPGNPCVLVGYPAERPGREPWTLQTKVTRAMHTLQRRDEWSNRFWTSQHPNGLNGASGGGVIDVHGRVVGILLGGTDGQMQHSRVELFRQQWDALAAGRPVDEFRSTPLADIAAAFSLVSRQFPSLAVEVLVDGKRQALGTIVGSAGRVLTPASVAAGVLTCRLVDGREVSANIQKQLPELGLAVLKIDAADLPEVRWSQDERIVPGKLIAAIIPGQEPTVGVASIITRSKPAAAGERASQPPRGDRAPVVPDSAFGTNLQLKPDSCGGPVIDRTGSVVGIAIAGQPEYGKMVECRVIPADVVRRLAAD